MNDLRDLRLILDSDLLGYITRAQLYSQQQTKMTYSLTLLE